MKLNPVMWNFQVNHGGYALNSEKIRTFIANKGYSTLSALKSEFSENEEILQINLNYLVEKNRIRKIKFQSPNGPEELFFILSEI